MTTSTYLTSDEAAAFLDISKATLYAYVSRGLIHSVPERPGSKRKLYDRRDLVRLRRHGHSPDDVGPGADVIEFGNPILTTAISLVTETEHSYRGVPSRLLAQHYTFEEVAQFLWSGETEASAGEDSPVPLLPPRAPHWDEELDLTDAASLPEHLNAVEKLQSLLPRLEHKDLAAHGSTAGALAPSASRIIRYLAYLSSGKAPEGPLAENLANTWNVDKRALDFLLVITADHELNIATFTARCVASAGGHLYQAVLAGLAALQGHKHLFGQVAECKRFFQEVTHLGDARVVIRRYLRNYGTVPGFHNPYKRLYVGTDPRVTALRDVLREHEGFELLERSIDLAQGATGESPRIDFALAVSEVLLGLPDDSIFDLIAIARAAGMIAHIIEQYSSERIIRPRAIFSRQIEL